MSKRLKFDVLRDWLSLAHDKIAVQKTLQRYANEHDFEWFTYLSLHESNVYGLSNYPEEWQRHYLEQRLVLTDPVVEAVNPRRGAFGWSEAEVPVPPRKEHRKFFGHARSFDIRSGVSIPIFGGFGRRALITFASSQARASTELLADAFSVLALGAFIDGFLRDRYPDMMSAADCPLTETQLETLSWLLHGKSNADIAVLRSTTKRAVEYQLQNIRTRLDVVNTYQAIGVAVHRKWILL
ncbi:LuxR family transcriptional regulator [Devosia sp. A369]